MLTLIAAIATFPALQGEAQGRSAVQLVGRMLAYYNDAKSMTGRIMLTQSANGVSGTVETFLQFETPSKLYIRQQKSVGDQRVFTVISDGKTFGYDSPVRDGKRLYEKVAPAKDYFLNVRQIYAATSAGLADRSTPLDIAIGRTEDLSFLKSQLVTVTYQGTTKYGEEDVHVVMGDWRPYGEAGTEGQYRMYITEGGELRQFALSQTIQPKGAPQAIQAMSTWNIKLTKNGKPDPALWSSVK